MLDLIPSAKLDEEMLKKMETRIGKTFYKHPIGLDSGFDLGGTVIKIIYKLSNLLNLIIMSKHFNLFSGLLVIIIVCALIKLIL